jgi:hypothetical protein
MEDFIMPQKIQRLLFLSAGMCTFLVANDPMIFSIRSVLAASSRDTVADLQKEMTSISSKKESRAILPKNELTRETAALHHLLGRNTSPHLPAEMSNDISLRPSSPTSQITQTGSGYSQSRGLASQFSSPNTILPSGQPSGTTRSGLIATPIAQDTLGSTSSASKAAIAPQPSPIQTRPSTAPLRRLMSEVPGLTQLAAPPISNPSQSSSKPVIGVSSPSFSFSVRQGDSSPTTQTLTVTNLGEGTLNWNAAAPAAWLTVGPASGQGTGTIALITNAGGLAIGTYNTTISLTAAGATSVIIPVNLTVEAPSLPPMISASPTTLSFTAVQGGSNPSSQTVSISNAGGGVLAWSANESASWLGISPASGTGNGPISVTATPGSLAVGTYNTLVTINAPNSAPVSIPISLTVTAPVATVVLSPVSLAFTGIQGGANPVAQAVTVNANGNWTASSSAPWLTLSPSSGNGNGSIATHIALSSAVVGTNNATITVTSGGVARTASVTLTVSAASLTASPNSVAYTATQGAANPSAQTIAISSNSTWTVSDGASWLSLSPTSGSNNGTITASVNTATATQGNNSTTITVKSAGITRTVNVTLTLNAPSSSSVTLTWNANTESDLAGYRVYRATSSGAYGAPIATIQGNTTSYIAAGLQFGTTYFFVVTAYDIAGNESAYSNEVSKSIF